MPQSSFLERETHVPREKRTGERLVRHGCHREQEVRDDDDAHDSSNDRGPCRCRRVDLRCANCATFFASPRAAFRTQRIGTVFSAS